MLAGPELHMRLVEDNATDIVAESAAIVAKGVVVRWGRAP